LLPLPEPGPFVFAVVKLRTTGIFPLFFRLEPENRFSRQQRTQLNVDVIPCGPGATWCKLAFAFGIKQGFGRR
jgi:hypothetical protein